MADTKYKITADGYGRDADYYQILAYATALDVPEGMLIYCQRDGSVPPQDIRVGKPQTHLITNAIGLSGTRDAVEQSLRKLAAHIAVRARDSPKITWRGSTSPFLPLSAQQR